MTKNLRACPFCGAEAKVVHSIFSFDPVNQSGYTVRCKNEYCFFVAGRLYSTEEEAIEFWNHVPATPKKAWEELNEEERKIETTEQLSDFLKEIVSYIRESDKKQALPKLIEYADRADLFLTYIDKGYEAALAEKGKQNVKTTNMDS